MRYPGFSYQQYHSYSWDSITQHQLEHLLRSWTPSLDNACMVWMDGLFIFVSFFAVTATAGLVNDEVLLLRYVSATFSNLAKYFSKAGDYSTNG